MNKIKDIKNKILNDIELFDEILSSQKSFNDICKHYDLPYNGKSLKFFKKVIKDNNLDLKKLSDWKLRGGFETKCGWCNTTIKTTPHVMNNSKSKKAFCGQSCSAMYNNTHKTFGYRRSKLEIWLEEQLTKLYPNLEIHFNRKDAINSELDIYIPSLKLAFELNGIFHYEPIYGKEKLEKIQNNDNRKFQACLEKQIELCIIDTSRIKYFKIENVKKYLDMIEKIMAIKISGV